ncbi:sensor histidine kinase [Peptoclostridium sp. AF21-18]|uniref:sensor histidine kinase n=1 Tax=Peptoclostridium sp. AF21-18 TaxID=2292243 RepID=UPI000E47A009|nr:HAMP domain-containing sensor histidine kinase [Peptoclostridium sp. AF21-18]RHQ98920.1 sensor histidine kinase [Peptoclostridium sp. AF21-18]
MIKKLRKKFIAISLLSTFIVLSVIISGIHIMNYHRIENDADRMLSLIAENEGKMPFGKPKFEMGKKYDFGKRDMIKFSPETPYETRYFSVVIGANGIVERSDTGKIAAIDTESAVQYAKERYNGNKSSGFEGNYRFLKSEKDGKTIITFLDCTRELEGFRSFIIISIIVSVLGLLAVSALIVIASKVILKPVEESYTKQKQFITNAGHEIKTPLTIIDANTEVIEMINGESEWTESIKNQVKRLASLTSDLISLSRMEEESRFVMNDFPISDVVEEEYEVFKGMADIKGKEMISEIEKNLSYNGDEKAIRQLTSILLDNAIKYTDKNGVIKIKLKKSGRKINLSVYNTVESITKEDTKRMFERFYRADSSRNSETGGYGIGLSIASAIVSAHKGKIHADTDDGKSLKISITI